MKKKYLVLITVLLFAVSGCDIFNTNFENMEDARMYRAKVITYAPVPSVLKIMTWNIKFGGARIDFFFDGWGDEVLMDESVVIGNTQNIANYINEVDPDIILLQELDIDSKRSAYVDQMQFLLDATELNYGAYASQWKADFVPSDGLGRMNSGNAIMSKWRITDAVRIALPLIDQDGLTQYFYLRRNILKTKIVIHEETIDELLLGSNNFVQRTHYFIEQPTELYELYDDNDGIEGVDYPLGWKDNAIKLDDYNGKWMLSPNGCNLLPDPNEELTIYLDDGLASNNALTIEGVNYIDPEDTYHFDILSEGIDYDVDYNSGIIVMTLPQGVNKIYSIGITYTRNDGVVVGNSSSSPVETKMLRIRNQDSYDADYWDLQVRNIYDIGIQNIHNDGFEMSVYSMPIGSTTQNYNVPPEVVTPNFSDITLNDYLRLDSNNDLQINGEDTTVDLVVGNIYLPFIKPFHALNDSIIYIEESVAFDEIENYIALTIREPSRELNVLNIHAAAYSKDGTKKEQIDIFKGELDDINNEGLLFVAGGDFNAIPPNSLNWLEEGFPDRPDDLGEDYEVEDYEITDMAEFYNDYHPDLPSGEYALQEVLWNYISPYYTHSIYINLPQEVNYDPEIIDIDWNRKLDYLFTNNIAGWIAGSNETHQETRQLSDHCPITVELEWIR